VSRFSDSILEVLLSLLLLLLLLLRAGAQDW
jgi:hypothetical protein